MQNRARAFHEASVESFSDAVVLRCIGSREASLRALLLKIIIEGITGKLTAAIRTESLDARAMLGLSPGREGLVGFKGFVLRPKYFKSGESCVIVSKGHIIPASSKTMGRRWPPNIGMDLVSKRLGRWFSAFFAYGLAGRLGIFTGITNKGRKIIDYLYSSDRASANKGSNGVN